MMMLLVLIETGKLFKAHEKVDGSKCIPNHEENLLDAA